MPGKTMREDIWLLPFLSQVSVGLLTGEVGGPERNLGSLCITYHLPGTTVLG